LAVEAGAVRLHVDGRAQDGWVGECVAGDNEDREIEMGAGEDGEEKEDVERGDGEREGLFFFEKKNQKTFGFLGWGVRQGVIPTC
jgi:hypothetical protein